MADLVITGVDILANTQARTIQLGEVVVANDILYLDVTTGKYFLASAAAVESANVQLVAVSGGNADDFILGLPFGDAINLVGPVFIQAERYVLSATPGKLAPRSDLLTGNFLTEVCIGVDAGSIKVNVFNSGITVP